jgi:type I restriction enzyme R subunit
MRDRLRIYKSLSRLDRIATGKEDTIVLDFVNELAEIYAAFRPYYELAGRASNS